MSHLLEGLGAPSAGNCVLAPIPFHVPLVPLSVFSLADIQQIHGLSQQRLGIQQ